VNSDDQLVVLDGSTFFVSQRDGDCPPSQETGFFHQDVRHLSAWRLLVDGQPIRLLTSRNDAYYSARVFGTLASAAVGRNPPVSVRRHRVVAGGLHEDLVVDNHGPEPCSLTLELEVAADFADLFEVKDGQPKRGRHQRAPGQQRLALSYQHAGFRRATTVTADQPCQVSHDGLRFELELAPHQRWRACVEVTCQVGGERRSPRRRCGDLGRLQPDMRLSLEEWLDRAPQLETDFDPLRHTYRHTLTDLAALRFRPAGHLGWSVPAAGLPWFMTLFGRDSLITAYQALPYHPELARSTLQALAGLQATERNDFADAEPGKILHEVRRGELAALGEWPSPYYGSHDATPLFLVLLEEYERWTGDRELVRKLEPAARAALGWIDGPGDPDGDGYLEYRTRSPRGLRNQCWKDSGNSICFADGRPAEPPIATCEIQGYAYDARRRLARLAREVWADPRLAERLSSDADALKERFNRDYWSERDGHYVLALDRDKRQVEVMTSNAGQLLWSGIVTEDRAGGLAERLMAPDMHSGWGIRTLSSRAAAYNPIEYHNGTVWPHDSALVAEGLRRYGYREQASRLAFELLEAAAAFAYRLPEVFAGYDRADTGTPVEYPTACRPQAWAAGTPLLAIRTLLGLEVSDGRLRAHAVLPDGLTRLALHGVPVRGGQAATDHRPDRPCPAKGARP
jgi:glycogen debranching enzyme